MNWRKPIYSNILRMSGSTMKYLAEYEKTQWYSSEQLEEYQREQLEKLLKHAAEHVPYYRETMQEHGLIKNGDVLLDRFTDLPFLTKDILRERFEELKSDDLETRKWHKSTSGGSTGEPVIFIHDRECHEKGRARMILRSKMAGKDIGQPEIVLWGSERDLFRGSSGMRARIANLICNRKFLNSFKMSPDDMREYISVINAIQPQLMRAYVQSAYEIARFSFEASIPIRPFTALMTEAGTLHPFMRETIYAAFGTPVFNHYGSREVGTIATECSSHLGLHVSMETHLIEIIDEQGNPCPPDENGELVITLLTNYVMPLIRYRIGDMGIWVDQGCTCGRGSFLLKSVTGRTGDTFLTVKGHRVYGGLFTYLIYFRDWVQKFQFIQEDFELIRAIIQTKKEPPTRDLREIEEKIKFVMGDSCKVEFEFVDDIAPSSSGKYRYTISKVYHDR